MDSLFNTTTATPQAAQTESADTAQSTLPSADIRGMRSAAMDAAGARSESHPPTAGTSRADYMRILIGADHPLSSVLSSFNSGRGVPFTPQELRETLAIIDALSRFSGTLGPGYPGVGQGDQRHPGRFIHARHSSHPLGPHRSYEAMHVGIRQSPASRETDRGRDPTPTASRDAIRPVFDRVEVAKEHVRAEPARERRHHTQEKVEPKTVDQPASQRSDRQEATGDKAIVRDQPTIQASQQPTISDTPRTPEPIRAQDPQQPTKENSTLVTAAITAALNESRNDTARLVVQVLNNDLSPRAPERPIADVTQQLTYSNPFEARERIQEKLGQIRQTLQTAIESSSPVTPSPVQTTPTFSQTNNSPTTGDFSRFEVPRSNVVPTHSIATQDRGVPDRIQLDPTAQHGTGSHLPRVDADGRIAAPQGRSGVTGPQALRAAGAGETSTTFAPLEKGIPLVDALSKSIQRVLNIQVLQKLDRILETVVISGAAGIALGVMGGEALLKQLAALSKELLARLRQSGPFTKEQEAEHQTIEEMIKELEETCHDRGIEKTERPAGFVADITGVIVFSTNGLPVEGVIVDGGPLGTTISDTFGEFKFTNIPLETGYSLTCHDHRYSFFPSPVVGTVSTMNHITISATKVP